MNTASKGLLGDFEHEDVVVRRGRRSGVPIIVAIHTSISGQAIGGCRLWRYPRWTDALTDALRLSAGMTAKCAVSGMARGGGKTVIAVPPERSLDEPARRDLLHDAGDIINGLHGRYATGPDVGTTPDDMAAIAERTTNVFCKPRELGGSGDSSGNTATGVMAALRALCVHLDGRPTLKDRRIGVVGIGHVGTHLARELDAAGANLIVADTNPGRRDLAEELGATWASPDQILTAELDILVPAALGGQLTEAIVPRLRCAAICGPANNQLAEPGIAELLHSRGIIWAPDYLVSAGGVLYAAAVEIDRLGHEQALERVRAIGTNLATLLQTARAEGGSPHQAARERIDALLRSRR